MKVPEYQNQVALDTPNVPMPNMSAPVRAAYGENVFRANDRIGNIVGDAAGDLTAHILKRRDEENSAKAAEMDTNFRVGLQGKLLDNSIEKVNVNGEDVDRPVGVLSRSGDQARGITQEFDDYYKKIRQEYVTKAPSARLAAELGKQMDIQYLSSRDEVIKHEAKEYKNSLIKAHVANLDQQVHDAASINDPFKLGIAIENAMKTQDQISDIEGWDAGIADAKRKERAGDIVSKSVTSTLSATGNLEHSKQMLENSKDLINPDRYEQISNALDSKKIQMDSLNNKAMRETHDQTLADLQDRLLNDDLTEQDLEDASKIPPEAGGLKPTELVSLKKGVYAAQNKTFKDVVNNNEDAAKYVELINDFASNPADVRAVKSMIINSYGEGILDKEESKNMDKLSKVLAANQWTKAKGFTGAVRGLTEFFGKKTQTHDQIAQSLHELVSRVNGGEHPLEVTNDIQNKQRLQKYPWIANVPAEGQTGTLNGVKVKIFPNGAIQAAK